MSNDPVFEFTLGPSDHVHGEPVTVSACTLHNLSAVAAVGMAYLPPHVALTLRMSMNQEAVRLIEAAERTSHAEFDQARMRGGDHG